MSRTPGLALIALLAAPALPAQQPVAAPAVRARSEAGQLIRVDLARGSVTVASGGSEPREYELQVHEGTRLVSRGRALALADLRPGQRVLVVYEVAPDGSRRASLLKLGPSSYAAPAPVETPRPR